MASVQFVGLNELILALMALPEELTARAGGIVEDAADAVMAEAAGGYAQHRHTGNLAKGLVKVEQSVGRFGVAYQVQNNATHSWWFEHGTETRRTKKNVPRGAMFEKHPRPQSAPGNVFIPAAERARLRMFRELMQMVEDAGLTVTSSAP